MRITASRRRIAGTRLRTVITAGHAALAAIALVACSALVVLSLYLRWTIEAAQLVSNQMLAAESLRVHLLAFARESDLALLTRDPAGVRASAVEEVELLGRLHEIRSGVSTDEQSQTADIARARISEYLAARTQAELPGALTRDIRAETAPTLSRALAAVRLLVMLDARMLADANARLRHLGRLGRLIGEMAGLFMIAGTLLIAVSVQHFVFHPLISLSDAIRSFGAGNREARAEIARGAGEIRLAASSFNEMADGIVRRREELLTFLAGIAHELRNPLTALRFSLAQLDPARPLPPEDKLRNAASRVNRQVRRLERMTSDLLDATRIEGGHLELRLASQDMGDLVREVADLYGSDSQPDRVSIALPNEPVLVVCDGERITQVLNNLVSNALKYSSAAGGVIVSLASDDEHAVVGVTDRGIGIAEGEIEHIFEPFSRGLRARDTAPGVGLGLSVSRRIAQAHGGTIEVESTPGVGSTFRLRLPLGVGPRTMG